MDRDNTNACFLRKILLIPIKKSASRSGLFRRNHVRTLHYRKKVIDSSIANGIYYLWLHNNYMELITCKRLKMRNGITDARSSGGPTPALSWAWMKPHLSGSGRKNGVKSVQRTSPAT